ncbi:Ankyrin repeat-containing domain superfamily [Sesbania bispinosa]|nr:Ankyrin repeat-containing domain superfamily [Sesbania bispinosa]
MNTKNGDRLKEEANEGDINLIYTLIQEDSYVLEHIDYIPFVHTPLHAASLGHVQLATEVMRLKPSFSWKLNQQRFSPIHIAIQHVQKRTVFRSVSINNRDGQDNWSHLNPTNPFAN